MCDTTISADGAVPEISFLYCTFGTRIGFLKATNMDVTISDEIMGTHPDKLFGTNVSGFIQCVVSESGRCGYVPGEWAPVDSDVTCGDLKTLRTDSKMTCSSNGGELSIFLSLGDLLVHAGSESNLTTGLVDLDQEMMEALGLFGIGPDLDLMTSPYGLMNAGFDPIELIDSGRLVDFLGLNANPPSTADIERTAELFAMLVGDKNVGSGPFSEEDLQHGPLGRLLGLDSDGSRALKALGEKLGYSAIDGYLSAAHEQLLGDDAATQAAYLKWLLPLGAANDVNFALASRLVALRSTTPWPHEHPLDLALARDRWTRRENGERVERIEGVDLSLLNGVPGSAQFPDMPRIPLSKISWVDEDLAALARANPELADQLRFLDYAARMPIEDFFKGPWLNAKDYPQFDWHNDQCSVPGFLNWIPNLWGAGDLDSAVDEPCVRHDFSYRNHERIASQFGLESIMHNTAGLLEDVADDVLGDDAGVYAKDWGRAGAVEFGVELPGAGANTPWTPPDDWGDPNKSVYGPDGYTPDDYHANTRDRNREAGIVPPPPPPLPTRTPTVPSAGARDPLLPPGQSTEPLPLPTPVPPPPSTPTPPPPPRIEPPVAGSGQNGAPATGATQPVEDPNPVMPEPVPGPEPG